MHRALVKELGRDPDETEKRCRADYVKGYGRKGAPKRNRQRKRRQPKQPQPPATKST